MPIASDAGNDSTYAADDTIRVAVVFNENVDVTGAPRLALGIGLRTRQASYAGGTGTDSLTFRYVVASGDADAGRVEHRCERADAERRDDQADGGRDGGRGVVGSELRCGERGGPQGAGLGRDDRDGRVVRERRGHRQHLRGRGHDRGRGRVQPSGGGDGYAAAGFGRLQFAEAGELRVGDGHQHAEVQLRGGVGRQRPRRDRLQAGCADAERRDDQESGHNGGRVPELVDSRRDRRPCPPGVASAESEQRFDPHRRGGRSDVGQRRVDRFLRGVRSGHDGVGYDVVEHIPHDRRGCPRGLHTQRQRRHPAPFIGGTL